MNCRHCDQPLTTTLVDLGTAPPSNAYVDEAAFRLGEVHYPLKVFVCDGCQLAQLDEFQPHREIFSRTYAYFSSFSSTWLAHARAYARDMIGRLSLGSRSFVCELASNDGYLLRNFVEAGIPCLGIEPASGPAAAARALGVETQEAFFGRAFAETVVRARGHADLVVGNNVLAHVPDLHDFVAGVRLLLAPRGTATFEFPHLPRLVAETQFDTIYHEHFSYFSLLAARRVFASEGLTVIDVEEWPTHGGSLRVFVAHAAGAPPPSAAVAALLAREEEQGFGSTRFCQGFQRRVERLKDDFLAYLIEAKRQGRRVCGYGAAAKGNTLLNFAGVRADLLPFVVDASPHKQGQRLPGSRIPIVGEAALREHRPHDVIILPWNLRDEVRAQLAYVGAWGGRFVTAVPDLAFFPAEDRR